jgi:hypothetical protein
MDLTIVPADTCHTATEAEPDRRRRSVLGDIDSVALMTRNEDRPPPPIVVGGRELVDGAVPTRYGPAEEPDADGWVLATPGRAPAPEGLPPGDGESLPGPPRSGAGGGPRGHGARPAPGDVAGVAADGLFRLAYRRGCAFTGRGWQPFSCGNR